MKEICLCVCAGTWHLVLHCGMSSRHWNRRRAKRCTCLD